MRRHTSVIVVAAAIAWAAALMIAPVAARGSGASASPTYATRGASLMYLAGALICHQRPERSFHLAGFQLPVCARCTGLYVGGALGSALWLFAPFGERRVAKRRGLHAGGTARVLLIGAAIPTLVSVLTSMAGWWDPGNAVRAVIALPLGAAIGVVLAAVAAGDLR